MRAYMDCVPCYLKQVISALKELGVDDDKGQKILSDLAPVVSQLAKSGGHATPAENSSVVLHAAYQLLGNGDPFQKAKEDSNQAALQLLPQLREVVRNSRDPLFTAFKVAVAGNIIDMGILPEYNLEESIDQALTIDFARNDYQSFREKLQHASRVLIIGDNSGEIAFDRLLVEELVRFGVAVTYAVKGGPILNDATMDDARQVGMDRVARVISNGNHFLGTVANRCSVKFLAEFRKADVVISKGQANYETLESTTLAGDKTFFVLRAKCDIVADSMKVKLGNIVLMQNQPNNCW